MRILELQEYAKDNGFDSVEFSFENAFGEEVKGKWLDAHFGFFRLETMKSNEMVTVAQWRRELGDGTFEFKVI